MAVRLARQVSPSSVSLFSYHRSHLNIFELVLILPRNTFAFTVKVWYPAILAHYKARRYGLKDYYRRLQIGLPGAPSRSTSTNEDNRTGSLQLQLPDKVQRAMDLGRKHKFEHPLGVKSTRRYTAGFDDCECIISVSGPVRSFVLASIDSIFFARSVVW